MSRVRMMKSLAMVCLLSAVQTANAVNEIRVRAPIAQGKGSQESPLNWVPANLQSEWVLAGPVACASWVPDASSIMAGASFTQRSLNCVTPYTAIVTPREFNEKTSSYRSAGADYSVSKEEISSSSRAAVGTWVTPFSYVPRKTMTYASNYIVYGEGSPIGRITFRNGAKLTAVQYIQSNRLYFLNLTVTADRDLASSADAAAYVTAAFGTVKIGDSVLSSLTENDVSVSGKTITVFYTISASNFSTLNRNGTGTYFQIDYTQL